MRVAGMVLVAAAVLAERRRTPLLLALGAVVLATTIPWFVVLRSFVPLWGSLRSPAHFADTLVLATAWAFGMSLLALERLLIVSWRRRVAASLLMLAVVVLDLWPSHHEFQLGEPLSPLERSVEALADEAPRMASRRVLPPETASRAANLVLESLPASSARSWVRWESTLFWQKLLMLISRSPVPRATELMQAARIDPVLLARRGADPPYVLSKPAGPYPEAWWIASAVQGAPPPVGLVLKRPAPGHLVLNVSPREEQGRIVVSEAYHPWWHATVDGQPVPVQVADVALLAVDVPAGATDVHLDFRLPGALWAAEGVDDAAWIAVALVGGALLWPRARRALRAIMPARTLRAGCVLGLVLFLLYNANGREIGFGDTIPAMLLPASLLREGNFDLNEYDGLLRQNPNPVIWMLAVQVRDGRLVSSYPVGASILSVPIYAPFVAAGGVRTWAEFRMMSKLTASIFVASSAVFLFVVMRRFVSPSAAAVFTIAYGLGTSAWPIASQALWQHGPGMFCLAVAVWLLARLEDVGPPRCGLLSVGIALGFAVASRTLNVVPALLLSIYALRTERRHALGLLLALAAFGTWIAVYNYTTFGDVRGGYDAIFRSVALAPLHVAPGTEFKHPLLPGLLGLLASPSRGLLWFSPFVLFAVAGAVRAFRPGGWALGRVLVAWVVIMVAVLSKYVMWWGGGSYGPRLLLETQIPLALLVAYGWVSWRSSRGLTAVFAACLAVAIGMQGIGAFYAPCDWDGRPARVDLHPERLWDWRDTEPLRCLRAGPRPFDLLPPNVWRAGHRP